ncbi:MAG TPA: hypothetical protein VK064_02990 [Wenzhouxiangella sp.]|nr:hypothetical protein [Wenzhouxiangella sp.]
MRIFLIIAALLPLLAACGGNQLIRDRDHTTTRWEALLRWNEFDALVDMMHPDWLSENPVRSVDLSRLKQFRVSEYRVRQVLAGPDDHSFERNVQIRLYHVHSARERVIVHHEVWRYDKKLERWLLHSGLPDPRQD